MSSLRDAFLGKLFCGWLVSLSRDDALEAPRKSVCKDSALKVSSVFAARSVRRTVQVCVSSAQTSKQDY